MSHGGDATPWTGAGCQPATLRPFRFVTDVAARHECDISRYDAYMFACAIIITYGILVRVQSNLPDDRSESAADVLAKVKSSRGPRRLRGIVLERTRG